MKFKWETDDIKGGRQVCKSSGKTNVIAEIWMIGYHCYHCHSTYSLVSLSDGAILMPVNTKAEIADLLNKSEYVPLSLT